MIKKLICWLVGHKTTWKSWNLFWGMWETMHYKECPRCGAKLGE